MMPKLRTFRTTWMFAFLFVGASAASAQGPAPPAEPTPPQSTTPAAPAAPPSPASGIRSKISAGDLLSAESILEVHRAKNGEDGPYLAGFSWLARGALLLGDTAKARRYASEVRALCASRMESGTDLEKDHDLETALGAAIEVEAQLIERARGADRAAEYVRAELAKLKGPVALRSRLNKRLDLLTLVGRRAPELEIDDFLGDRPPTLTSLRGKPVLLFLWAEWCGDCKAQAAALARARTRYGERGLQVIALTRYYEEEPQRVAEKARVDSVWKDFYADVGTVPMVFSTASMERYGGSSTPTFVFVDHLGIVRRYTPTRLTEAELDRTLTTLVR